MKLVIDKNTRDELISLYAKKKIGLEGNILKLIATDDKEFSEYIDTCITKDNENRRKRLDITKQIQSQNTELIKWRVENQRINDELTVALKSAQDAKSAVENDLDILQKKTQFELISVIVKVALFVIMGVGVITTIMYGLAIVVDRDTQIIGSTWSNMFGILLTNAFSIIGTIMGVKYATEKENK
jgi:hypothetical protein